MHCKRRSAISEKTLMSQSNLMGTGVLFNSLKRYRTGDMSPLLWLAQPVAANLVNSANYAKRKPNDDD